MFKKLVLSSVLALSFAVIGCGKSDSEKAADKGNANIAKINKLAVKLRAQGVQVQVDLTEDQSLAVSKLNMASKNGEEKSALLVDLKKYVSLATQTLELGTEDNVKLQGAAFLQKNVRICQALIKDLQAEGVKVPAAPAKADEEEEEATPAAAVPGTNVA